MKIQDLYKLNNIRTSQRVLQRQIETLDRYGEENAAAIRVLSGALYELMALDVSENENLRTFIGNVADNEIREILRLRFLEGKPWTDVAEEIVPLEKDTTRTTPIKKVERFLKNF